MEIIELDKRNSLLDADLTRRELAIVETKRKMDEITNRLKVMEEINLELDIVISEIDCHGEELQNVICAERKIIEE
jgi:hypothetical protein